MTQSRITIVMPKECIRFVGENVFCEFLAGQAFVVIDDEQIPLTLHEYNEDDTEFFEGDILICRKL